MFEPKGTTVAQKLDYLKVCGELIPYLKEQAQYAIKQGNALAFQDEEEHKRYSAMSKQLEQSAQVYRQLQDRICADLMRDKAFTDYAESIMPGYTQAVAMQPVQEQQEPTHHM